MKDLNNVNSYEELISGEQTNKPEDEKNNIAPARKVFKKASLLGIVVFFLSIIGAITVLTYTISLISLMFNKDGVKQKYEEVIAPVVLYDAIPFEEPTKAENSMLIQTAVWQALSGENKATYSYDELGRVMIPAVDIEKYAKILFSSAVQVQHGSINDIVNPIEYNEEQGMYHTPKVIPTGYSPKIIRMKKEGSKTVSLVVGYVAPVVWGKIEDAVSDDIVKYAVYTLKKENKGYYVYSVADYKEETFMSSAVSLVSEALVTSEENPTSETDYEYISVG